MPLYPLQSHGGESHRRLRTSLTASQAGTQWSQITLAAPYVLFTQCWIWTRASGSSPLADSLGHAIYPYRSSLSLRLFSRVRLGQTSDNQLIQITEFWPELHEIPNLSHFCFLSCKDKAWQLSLAQDKTEPVPHIWHSWSAIKSLFLLFLEPSERNSSDFPDSEKSWYFSSDV